MNRYLALRRQRQILQRLQTLAFKRQDALRRETTFAKDGIGVVLHVDWSQVFGEKKIEFTGAALQ